jgi:hypothetical protein
MAEYTGADITIEIHRGTIDPEGIGTDEEAAQCEEYVLDYVRNAFPGATVRALGNGGRTAGVHDGRDITSEVRDAVQAGFDAWCAAPAKRITASRVGTPADVIAAIQKAGRKAGQLYTEEFPGEELDENWLGSAYEIDAGNNDWPDDSYGQWYEPAARSVVKSR